MCVPIEPRGDVQNVIRNPESGTARIGPRVSQSVFPRLRFDIYPLPYMITCIIKHQHHIVNLVHTAVQFIQHRTVFAAESRNIQPSNSCNAHARSGDLRRLPPLFLAVDRPSRKERYTHYLSSEPLMTQIDNKIGLSLLEKSWEHPSVSEIVHLHENPVEVDDRCLMRKSPRKASRPSEPRVHVLYIILQHQCFHSPLRYFRMSAPNQKPIAPPKTPADVKPETTRESLIKQLNEAELILSTALYQSKQKLSLIKKANKRPVYSEDLIRYAHNIS